MPLEGTLANRTTRSSAVPRTTDQSRSQTEVAMLEDLEPVPKDQIFKGELSLIP